MKTAAEIVLNWINKFKEQNGHLPKSEEIEAQLSMAISEGYANQSREEGSGKLEEVFRNFIRTEQLTAKWEEFLSNNNH